MLIIHPPITNIIYLTSIKDLIKIMLMYIFIKKYLHKMLINSKIDQNINYSV